MNWQGVYLGSKKVHKLCMWGVVVSGTPQLLTGVLMILPLGLGRSLNNSLLSVHVMVAPWFALLLFAQIMTGLLMWLSPKMIARRI